MTAPLEIDVVVYGKGDTEETIRAVKRAIEDAIRDARMKRMALVGRVVVYLGEKGKG